jgi:AraC family transcriptional regulator, regulatory protein of adaptative response / methylated-DNA-[protein]-cysteine methyltransferase
LEDFTMSATATVTQFIATTTFDSPVGPLTAGATDEGICLLEFAGPRSESQANEFARLFDAEVAEGEHRFLDQLQEELSEYFAGERREFTVPMVIRGTPFQEKVWRELCRIPYGETCSYADVAREVCTVKASRAVGRANGQNRMAIIIPCHRVVNTGGALGGYGGGLDRKRLLLDLERRAAG